MTKDAIFRIYSSSPSPRFGLGFAVRKDVGVSPFLGSAGEYNYLHTLKAMVYAALMTPAAR
jgi:hypothetical protein